MLPDLQRALERLYRLEPAPDVRRFLVKGRGRVREELLLVEEEDLFVGLVLDPAAVDRLADPHLDDDNLGDFALVVEGVSHFLMVMHRARQGRPFTLVELELQAEVDKYVAALLLAQRCPSLASEHLRWRIYHHFHLRDELDLVERRRYLRANTLARRYAAALERRYLRRQRLPAMLRELRRFYRLGYHAKADVIARAA